MAQCLTCGHVIPEGADTCPTCGSAIGASPAGADLTREECAERTAGAAGVEVGFSPIYDTPEFQATLEEAIRAENKAGAFVVVLAPLFVAALVAFIKGPGYFLPGLFVSYLIVIPVVLYTIVKRDTGRTWDGEVVDFVRGRPRYGVERRRVVCRTDEGKRVSVDDYHELHAYLHIGDRVRFHPRLNVPLEKYDKTHDTHLMCLFCGALQAPDADVCAACGKPLLK